MLHTVTTPVAARCCTNSAHFIPSRPSVRFSSHCCMHQPPEPPLAPPPFPAPSQTAQQWWSCIVSFVESCTCCASGGILFTRAHDAHKHTHINRRPAYHQHRHRQRTLSAADKLRKKRPRGRPPRAPATCRYSGNNILLSITDSVESIVPAVCRTTEVNRV